MLRLSVGGRQDTVEDVLSRIFQLLWTKDAPFSKDVGFDLVQGPEENFLNRSNFGENNNSHDTRYIPNVWQ